MPTLVQKYGGSSVADVTKIGQVADKVVAAKKSGHDVVVVVSAMGKATDGLLELAKSVAATFVGHAGTKREPPRRELDMLVSTGERVTMALLSMAIHARGEGAISFTGSQSGIITNDRHFDARIIEVRPHRIEDELARGRIVIVAGYQGVSYKKEITTLGRGGSDTTAVALAAALGALQCEIYSDVDGVYSADPRVVPDSVHLPTMDLAMLQEMAESGAKVLNAQAVEWARRAKIVLHARQTTDTWNAPTTRASRRARRSRSEGGGDASANARAIVGLDRVVRVRARAKRRRRAGRGVRDAGDPAARSGGGGRVGVRGGAPPKRARQGEGAHPSSRANERSDNPRARGRNPQRRGRRAHDARPLSPALPGVARARRGHAAPGRDRGRPAPHRRVHRRRRARRPSSARSTRSSSDGLERARGRATLEVPCPCAAR